MLKCPPAFLPARAHSASVYSAVFLFCCSFEATAEKKEERMGKFLLYFSLIWQFIPPDYRWSKKMILPPRTPEVFRGRKKAPFAFNCFPFILNEQWFVPWNSRQSVRLVQKVSQTSNKGNMKALCGLGFLWFFSDSCCASGLQKTAETPTPHFLR